MIDGFCIGRPAKPHQVWLFDPDQVINHGSWPMVEEILEIANHDLPRKMLHAYVLSGKASRSSLDPISRDVSVAMALGEQYCCLLATTRILAASHSPAISSGHISVWRTTLAETR